MNVNETLAWIADIFQEPVENIAPETRREDIPGWDSLGVLSLMAEMDETFDILLEEDDLDTLQTVADILTLLENSGKLTLDG